MPKSSVTGIFQITAVFSLVVFAAGYGSRAFADPQNAGNVGRTQDGRAYRVDAQGYQLTDQVAELEVTIREQEKQISACEERLEQSEKGLPAAQRSSSLPAPNGAAGTASSCAAFTTPLELQVQDLRNQIVNRAAPTCNYAAQAAPLQAQIAQLQAQLSQAPKVETFQKMSEQSMALKSSLDGEREQIAQQNKSLELEKSRSTEAQTELSQLKSQLALKESELAERKQREQELLANIDKLSNELTRQSSNAPAPSTAGRAMLASSAPASTTSVRTEGPRTELSGETKKKVQTELANIQKLVVERKDLFDSVRAARKGVTVGIQSLETSKRVTLDQLRGVAMNPGSEEQAQSVLNGLSEIQALLQSDIQVLDRLMKHL